MAKNVDKKAMDKEITDSLLDDFDKFEHYAMTYWKPIIAVCILIIVVVAVVAAGYSIKMSKEKKMEEDIANAKSVAELQKVIKDYSDKKAVIYAYSGLANKFVNKKEFKKAEEVYAVLLSKEIPQDMKWQVNIDLGYLKELTGDKKGAVQKFAQIGTDSFYPKAMRCEANYSAGRIEALIGDKKKAVNYLKYAVSLKDPQNPAAKFWSKQAMSLIQTLESPEKKTVAKKPVVTKPAPKKAVKKAPAAK